MLQISLITKDTCTHSVLLAFFLQLIFTKQIQFSVLTCFSMSSIAAKSPRCWSCCISCKWNKITVLKVFSLSVSHCDQLDTRFTTATLLNNVSSSNLTALVFSAAIMHTLFCLSENTKSIHHFYLNKNF